MLFVQDLASTTGQAPRSTTGRAPRSTTGPPPRRPSTTRHTCPSTRKVWKRYIYLSEESIESFFTGDSMKKVPRATCPLRDNKSPLNECTHQVPFIWKSAVSKNYKKWYDLKVSF